MKRKIFFILMLMASSSSVFAAREGDQGLGIMVGNPTGVSYKMWLNEAMAFDAAAGVAQSEFDMHADLLWHSFNWYQNMNDGFFSSIKDNGALPFYFGVGPRVLFEHDTEVGIRLPFGLSYLPNNSPFEFFGEIAPVVRLTPDTGVDGDFAIGLRYYFFAVRPRSNN